MKRRFIGLTVLLAAAVLFFTGCSAENDMKSGKSWRSKNTPEYAMELMTEIMECFRNRDKEKLNGFLNDYYRDSPQIDKDIDEAFDFIDGKIIAYDHIYAGGGTRYAYDDLYYVAYHANTYIITDKGAEYEIFLKVRLRDDEDSKNVGVRVIEIRNKNKDWASAQDWRDDWRRYKEFVFLIGSPDNPP